MINVCIFGGQGDAVRKDVVEVLKRDLIDIIENNDKVIFSICKYGYLGQEAIIFLSEIKDKYKNIYIYVLEFINKKLVLSIPNKYSYLDFGVGGVSVSKDDELADFLKQITEYSEKVLCVVDSASFACEKNILKFAEKNNTCKVINYFSVYANYFDEFLALSQKRLI